jgi:hypothetical protein
MPRKAAAVRDEQQHPADISEIIPPHQVPQEEREAYWQGLLQNLSGLRAAIATTEFFPLLRAIPKALWERRLFVYLYRTHPKVKNSDKIRYIDKIAEPIDEAWVKENHGGGGYTAYLNLDGEDQLKQISFMIDGAPKFQPGQVLVDEQGNPLSSSAAKPAESERSDLAQVLEASRESNKAALEGASQIVEIGGELLKKQLGLTPPPENKLQDRLLEILLTRTLEKEPAADPMTLALTLMERFESIIAKRSPVPSDDAPEKETKLNETIDTIKELTGVENLRDLWKKADKVTDNSYGWVGPVVGAAQSFFQQLPLILHQMAENRRLEFERAVYLRSTQQPGAAAAPAPSHLLAPAPAPAPPAQQVAQRHPAMPQPGPIPVAPGQRIPPASAPAAPPLFPAEPQAHTVTSTGSVDIGTLLQATVQMIQMGFRRDPYSGEETAAAVAFHFSNEIESLGIQKFISDQQEMHTFVLGHPELATLSQDARWKEFEEEFVGYMADRFDVAGPDESVKPETKSGPQPAA